MTAERVLVLHSGDLGTELLAHSLVLDHADELARPALRLSTYTVDAAGGRCVVVVVWADEVNAWVLRTATKHLARVEATGFMAHWLACGHVLHLAYFSPDPDVAPLVPWGLPSRTEKRGGGELS